MAAMLWLCPFYWQNQLGCSLRQMRRQGRYGGQEAACAKRKDMKLGKYVKDIYNNVFDANEIVWLLKGREDMTAYDFVCECILNVAPENISAVLEDCLKPSYSAYGKKKNVKEFLWTGNH